MTAVEHRTAAAELLQLSERWTGDTLCLWYATRAAAHASLAVAAELAEQRREAS